MNNTQVTTAAGTPISLYGTSAAKKTYDAERRIVNAQDLKDKQQNARIKELERKIETLQK